MSIEEMRRTYTIAGLDVADVDACPFQQFDTWFRQARESDLPPWMEVNAMTLATACSSGHVTSRTVLLKAVEQERFVFYTNYESDKGRQIAENPRVSLCFFWPHLERQVRIEGVAEKVDRETSERYFHSRPRASQIGAIASKQSTVVAERSILEAQFAAAEKQHEGQEVPLPDNWGGYGVRPEAIEFWQGRPSRLHDRIWYVRDGDAWRIERRSP